MKLEAEIQWAFFNRKSEMSGKYQVDLCNLSAAAVKALADIGLTARQRPDKPEKGWFITAKSIHEITPYDVDGKAITDQVANGSKAVVILKPFHWTWKNKTGISPSVAKITITDLIVYKGAEEASQLEEDDIPL